jgi:tRNA dimethylallyltransferase
LAIALARWLNSAIISADSRQVYREFNIGTAKPTALEQQQVPHYLIDICDPTETLTLADYQQQVRGLIEGHKGDGVMGKDGGDGGDGEGLVSTSPALPSPPPSPPPPPSPLLLVGGTGLYIKSIVRGMKIPRVSPQPELRAQLLELGQRQSYALLQQVDPPAAEKIHPHDSVRTVRSLEVFYVTGCPISQQQGEEPPAYPILQIGLDCRDTGLLKQRIEQRTKQMVQQGLIEEVNYLCQKYGTDLPLLDTLGYQEFKAYLAGEISCEEAIAQTVLHTRQFAKRQRTWFRAYPEIEWFDADSPNLIEQVRQRVERWLNQ